MAVRGGAVVVAFAVSLVATCGQAPSGPSTSTPSPSADTRPVYRVTNLNDSGQGSLRDALSQGNRTIVFDVGGSIQMTGDLRVTGLSSITIDGTTAPPPGITLTGGGALSFENGANNIVVKSIRVRSGSDDNIRVFNSHDILFDHVSCFNGGDGNLDITTNSYNVTVQWSILIKQFGTGSMLIKYNTFEVTLHHNLFNGVERNPLLSVDDSVTSSLRTMADIRNNIIWNWGGAGGSQFGYGVGVDWGAHANIVNNFFEAHGTYSNLAELAVVLNHNGSGAEIYASGNISGNGVDVNRASRGTPFTAPAVATDETCAAARRVLELAGARPLDAIDQDAISKVSLANCRG
jgi:pectate lyase